MSASDSNGVLQQPTEGLSPRQNTAAPAYPSTESLLEKKMIYFYIHIDNYCVFVLTLTILQIERFLIFLLCKTSY